MYPSALAGMWTIIFRYVVIMPPASPTSADHRMPPPGLLHQRRAILGPRLVGPAELEQHVAEQLAPRRERPGGDRTLLRRVLARDRFPHLPHRLRLVSLGEAQP